MLILMPVLFIKHLKPKRPKARDRFRKIGKAFDNQFDRFACKGHGERWSQKVADPCDARQNLDYYAVKKVFVNFSRSSSKFLRSFSKLSQVFWGFPDPFEAFGSIRTHWDAFGCIRKQLEAFGRFRFFLRFFEFLSRFSTFPDVIFTKDFFHGTICAWPSHFM